MKTVIFGLGGVLIDSEKHWREDQMIFFQQRKPTWSAADMEKTIGIDIHDLYRYALSRGVAITMEELERAYDELDARVYGEESQPLEGVEELLAVLKQNHTLAIATSTRRKNLDLVLKRFNWEEVFACVISADESGSGKPQPNSYLHVARLLGVQPSSCIVIEDSTNGLLAAREAGMASIAIRGTAGQDLSMAQIVVERMSDITPEMIDNPFTIPKHS